MFLLGGICSGKEVALFRVARKSLGNMRAPNEGKAKGIEMLNGKTATKDHRFVIVYDGVKKGWATAFTCKTKGYSKSPTHSDAPTAGQDCRRFAQLNK